MPQLTIPHSGRMMLRVPRSHYLAIVAPSTTLTRPLFSSDNTARALLPGGADEQQWLLHEPDFDGRHPWDVAHDLARGRLPQSANLVAPDQTYVEPDILHSRTIPEAKRSKPKRLALVAPGAVQPVVGLNDQYAPSSDTIFSPGWHLQAPFANFVGAWARSTGAGIRIAHLDTGYWPPHVSTPRNVLVAQGYNYFEGNTNTVDPGLSQFWEMPGHGTATLALLAGNTVNIQYGVGPAYAGPIGGAPDSDIIPVRIGPSVVHLYTADLAQGLDHALAPRGAAPCDVVSLSHGGLPSTAWAAAVNRLYDAGIVVVAAAGDSFYLKILDVATHFTVYPSAFYRVITATGATYAKGPYKTEHFGTMQGCWGPDKVMAKAAGAFTPNVPWMRFKSTLDWDMNGGGTSASTPQIAAACALWLAQFGKLYPAGWQRVEACRHALFESLQKRAEDKTYIGGGILDAGAMLSDAIQAKVQAALATGVLPHVDPDAVSFPFWRLLFGLAPPGKGVDEMYETEAAQVFYRSKSKDLANLIATNVQVAGLGATKRKQLRDSFVAEPTMSQELQRYLKNAALQAA